MENNTPVQQPTSSSISTKTILLIIGLFALTVLLIFVAVRMRSGTKLGLPGDKEAMTPTPTPPAHTLLSFSPSSLTVDTSTRATQTLDIMVDSQGDPVSGFQLEISFDPKVVSVTSLAPGTFLPNPLVLVPAKIDNTLGTATIMFAKTPSQDPKSGQGVAAKLGFSVKSPSNGSPSQTSIKILPTSLVSATGVKESVLKTPSNATIMLKTAVQGAKTQEATTPAKIVTP